MRPAATGCTQRTAVPDPETSAALLIGTLATVLSARGAFVVARPAAPPADRRWPDAAVERRVALCYGALMVAPGAIARCVALGMAELVPLPPAPEPGRVGE